MNQKWRIPKKQPWRTHQKSQKVLSSQVPECRGPCPFDRCKDITHWLRAFALDTRQVKGHPLIIAGMDEARCHPRCHTGTVPGCLQPAFSRCTPPPVLMPLSRKLFQLLHPTLAACPAVPHPHSCLGLSRTPANLQRLPLQASLSGEKKAMPCRRWGATLTSPYAKSETPRATHHDTRTHQQARQGEGRPCPRHRTSQQCSLALSI